MKFFRGLAIISVLLMTAMGCDSENSGDRANRISIDGSNTVFPLTGALSEEYQALSGANITIAVSGTGGGFQKFCRNETDITGASRPIRDVEIELCAENGIEFIEIPIAYDGLTVAVHPDNDWAESMTVAELKKLWEPEAQGEITQWNHIRDEWPEEPIRLFGNSTDNGTYDYFTHAIVGQQHTSRGDYTASVDSNILIQGISGNPNALGFFSYAYYYENQDAVKSVGIKLDEDAEAIHPNYETIKEGSYQPLARPMFFYFNAEAAQRPEIRGFVEFIVNDGGPLVEEVGYVPLPETTYALGLDRFQSNTMGTVFEHIDGAEVGLTAEDLLRQAEDAQ